jgi:hypothetical protein
MSPVVKIAAFGSFFLSVLACASTPSSGEGRLDTPDNSPSE